MDYSLVLQLTINGLLIGGVYGLVAIGLTLIFGVLKLITFAHGESLMLGMYATYWLCTIFGLDPYIAALITIPLLFLVGAVIYFMTMRPLINAATEMQFLMTIGLSMFLQNLAVFLWTPNYRTVIVDYAGSGLFIAGLSINIPKLFAFLISMLLSGTLFFCLKKTKHGVAIRAAAENRDIALICGISINHLYWVTFGIGVAIAGVAGAVITPFFYIEPFVGWNFIINAFVIIIMGGLGSLAGAFYCSLIVGIAQSLSIFFIPASLKELVSFAILVAILILRPSGLFGGRA